jgi:hypothetical protein
MTHPNAPKPPTPPLSRTWRVTLWAILSVAVVVGVVAGLRACASQ